ncbi:MCE family protein [Haloechinothrix halophila]|uniref:MCE family protein n=1 Tax=Haloechinothrix halophila TaxID=1069073 RepID=UPI0004159EFE|nr:MlaD family protein [Haloechinothrix halophila]
MLSKLVRIQVSLFAIVALVGVGYVGATYAGLDTLVGGNGYVVTARMADSGGIFTHAEVTYRGVPIGRVGELRLVDDGIEVELRIRDDAPRVPSDVEAVVANRSAAGEQYIDLRPRRSGSPYLAEGSVIERADTSTPLPVETVLLNLDELVTSVPGDDLRTVVDELYDATRDTAPGMQALLDSSASLTEQAKQHLPQTTRLIADAGTVLDTQLATSDAITTFAANAKRVAAELRRADGDFRAVLTEAPSAAAQVKRLLEESGPTLGVLLHNLLDTSTVVLAKRDGLERLLVVTPEVVSAGSTVITKDGASFGLLPTFFDPLPCTTGYEGTKYRNGLETSESPLNTQAGCR